MESKKVDFQSHYFCRKVYFTIILFGITVWMHSQNITEKEIITPHKISNTIHVDGILNEPVWQQAILSKKLSDENGTYDNTEAYFIYDTDNLYAGFTCSVNSTSKLNPAHLDKDNEFMLGNDWVALCVDTYKDGLNAYTFLVDAAGNQLDGALTPSTRDFTLSFSSKWTSAVTKNESAYTVEMKIPLENLPTRWNKDSVAMALQVIRNDTQNHRMVQWPFTNNIGKYQTIVLHEINKTHPHNLSGVAIKDRYIYKKSRIDASTLLGRCQGGDASVMDYLIFKKRIINGVDHPRELHINKEDESVKKAFENTKFFKNTNANVDFETLLERAQTSAFIVLRNDTIIYENYFNGFSKDSTFTSFSVAKSFVSTLIGMAISDGYIRSENDRITEYLPELMKKDSLFSEITIKDLLSMSSGLAYSGDGFPSDDDITYQSPNLRAAIFNNVQVSEPSGRHWLYNNYNPLLLGLILERTTKMSVSQYAEEKLWKKMGGSDASWSLDEFGFEKMESGINCSAYDFARFALLCLNEGKYKDVQVIPKGWIEKATQPQDRPEGYYDHLLDRNVYYNYFWWGKFRDNSENSNDFFGMGNKGEYVYICPQKDLIIIRLGFEYGFTPGSFSWPEMFYEFATDYN